MINMKYFHVEIVDENLNIWSTSFFWLIYIVVYDVGDIFTVIEADDKAPQAINNQTKDISIPRRSLIFENRFDQNGKSDMNATTALNHAYSKTHM